MARMCAYTSSNAATSASHLPFRRATTSFVVVDRCFFIMADSVAFGQFGFAPLRNAEHAYSVDADQLELLKARLATVPSR